MEVTYKESSGSRPYVQEFIQSIESKKDQAKIIYEIDQLEESGMTLLDSKRLEKINPHGLFSLRVKCSDKIYRILMKIRGNVAILLHGFVKKTEKIPLKEIRKALGRI